MTYDNKGKVLREHKPPPKEMIFVKMALLTFDHGVRSKVISPNERSYVIFYNMCLIIMKFLFLIVFEI